jgi:hypothetical protein
LFSFGQFSSSIQIENGWRKEEGGPRSIAHVRHIQFSLHPGNLAGWWGGSKNSKPTENKEKGY